MLASELDPVTVRVSRGASSVAVVAIQRQSTSQHAARQNDLGPRSDSEWVLLTCRLSCPLDSGRPVRGGGGLVKTPRSCRDGACDDFRQIKSCRSGVDVLEDVGTRRT